MISEQLVIEREVTAVYRAFEDLQYWRQVLPDVLGVEVLYDDGRQQEFLMTVERPAGPETVRGFRFLVPQQRIELVQPQPPPGFKRMAGVWTFTPGARGTLVEARRTFELATGGDPEQARRATEETAQKLRGYLRKNLELFKAALEARP